MKKILSFLFLILFLSTLKSLAAAPPPQLTYSTEGTKVTFQWTTTKKASGYRFHSAPYPLASPEVAIGPELMTSTDLGDVTTLSKNLYPGAAQYVMVEAYDNKGQGSFSNIILFNLYADHNLETCIEETGFRFDDITVLECPQRDIRSLEGLENLEKIQRLAIYDNQIEQLTPLSGLSALESLDASMNKIIDVSPLGNLLNLWDLALDRNMIVDISPLQNLVNLTQLFLFENCIDDFSPLDSLANITVSIYDPQAESCTGQVNDGPPPIYLEFRNYADGTQRYQAVAYLPGVLQHNIKSIELFTPTGEIVPQSRGLGWFAEDFFLAEALSNGSLNVSDPKSNQGYVLYFDDASAELLAGTYTLHITFRLCNSYEKIFYYPGKTVLEAIDSTSMSQTVNDDGSLTFDWVPVESTLHDRQRVTLFDQKWETILGVVLDTETSSVTIPADLITKAFDGRSITRISWRVENRLNDPSGMNIARGISDTLFLSCGDELDCSKYLLAQDADLDGFTVQAGDCNDASPDIHPGALEVCGDGIDQDCSGIDHVCGTSVEPILSLEGLGAIDAHAHPEESDSLQALSDADFCASSFSAIGDYCYHILANQDLCPDDLYVSTMIDQYQQSIEDYQLNLILSSIDLDFSCAPGTPPGALLSIEGAGVLMGNLDMVDHYYNRGVRSIQLIHDRNNELGDMMRRRCFDPGPYIGGLTKFGKKVIRRMQKLGMIVDVAHASSETLQDVVAFTSKPIIDSHTSPRPPVLSDQASSRLRTWQDMALVASTGGAVCTWPAKYRIYEDPFAKPLYKVETISDWADEIVEMKNRLGIEHICLGTDTEGLLALVDGYQTVKDVVKLANALRERGFSDSDLQLFLGGNLKRIFQDTLK